MFLSNYHTAGIINSVLFLLSVVGLWIQLKQIWRRKKSLSIYKSELDVPTAVLSLNRFFIAFMAFYLFLAYGMTVEPFNHYLVWPRLAAILPVLLILWEIMIDRRNRSSTIAFFSCLIACFFAVYIYFYRESVAALAVPYFQTMIVLTAVLLFQSYLHQIIDIRRSKSVGAISLKTHQLILAKDLSSVLFGLAMGLSSGWPVFVLGAVSSFNQAWIIWHFRWVRKASLLN